MKIRKLIKTLSAYTVLVTSFGLTIYPFFYPIETRKLTQFIGFVVATFTIYIITIIFDETDHINETKLSLDKIKQDIQNNNAIFVEEICKVNQTQSEVIISSQRFYTLLKQIREKATYRVQLTQLDPGPPTVYGEKVRAEYFDQTIEFAKKNPTIKVQRIMSIPTIEKLEWAQEMIENSTNLNNLHFAYIKIDDIQNISPTPPILSLQIIDENEMLLLDPCFSYMPMSFKPCLYLKDNEVVKKVFSKYYDSLWDSLERDNAVWMRSNSNEKLNIKGFILKDGMDITAYVDKINWIKNIIKQTQRFRTNLQS